MEIKKPRTGETLVGVKKDEYGNTREHRYSTDPRVTIDSIRARPEQIKKIPMMEAAQRMSKQKNKRTVSDLTREMDYYRQTSLDIQKAHYSFARAILRLQEKLDILEGKDPKKGKGSI